MARPANDYRGERRNWARVNKLLGQWDAWRVANEVSMPHRKSKHAAYIRGAIKSGTFYPKDWFLQFIKKETPNAKA